MFFSSHSFCHHYRLNQTHHMTRKSYTTIYILVSIKVFMYLSVSGIATTMHFVALCLQQLKGGCVDMYVCQCCLQLAWDRDCEIRACFPLHFRPILLPPPPFLFLP